MDTQALAGTSVSVVDVTETIPFCLYELAVPSSVPTQWHASLPVHVVYAPDTTPACTHIACLSAWTRTPICLPRPVHYGHRWCLRLATGCWVDSAYAYQRGAEWIVLTPPGLSRPGRH